MYRKNAPSWFKHFDFLVLDMLCLHISFALACVLDGIWGKTFDSQDCFSIAVVITGVNLLIIVFYETFHDVLNRGVYREFATTVKHLCLLEMVMTVFVFLAYSSDIYPKYTIYTMGAMYFISTILLRFGWKQIIKRLAPTKGNRSLLIVTTNTMVHSVVKAIQNNNYSSFRISGIAVIDRDLTGKEIRGVKVVANIGDVANYVCREWVDEVFIDIPSEYPYPARLIDKFSEMGIVVHMNLDSTTYKKLGQNQIVEKIGSYTVLTTSINFATPGHLFIKRVMDIVGGLFGCIATGFLTLILGPIIYLKSPGPIFFKQERVGKNGKKFKMYKFRSMYLDAEERKKELMEDNIMSDGLMFKAEFDPRIIGCKKRPDGTVKKGIGNYIRDFSLDEFPQFINVLKGEMSLVGTRPPTIDEWERYELHHRARLATKPGVTGMWQVSGRNKITDFEEVVRLDTQYINEWNIGLDFKILFKTITVVFKREGSM